MKRGVVFSPVEFIRNQEGTGFASGRHVSPQDLNYLVLYWDRLVAPTSMIHIGFQNEDELINCGVLDRPSFLKAGAISAVDIPQFYADIQLQALEELRAKNGDTDWCLHFLNEDINVAPGRAELKETIRFDLLDELPVPQIDVPLHDVLEFKERRADALLEFHEYLDELYLEIMNSGDIHLQKAKSIAKLKKAIDGLEKLNQETWQSPIKMSIGRTIEFDAGQLFAGGLTLLNALQSTHPVEVIRGAAIPMLMGLLKIQVKLQSVKKGGDKKISYLTMAKRENLIK